MARLDSAAVELRIVPREAVYTDQFLRRCLTEYVVPRWVGVEVLHCDRQDTECVRWHTRLQEIEYIVRICKLPVYGLWRVLNEAPIPTAGSSLASIAKKAAANSHSLAIKALSSGGNSPSG